LRFTARHGFGVGAAAIEPALGALGLWQQGFKAIRQAGGG
jgi:hypothetical protein